MTIDPEKKILEEIKKYLGVLHYPGEPEKLAARICKKLRLEKYNTRQRDKPKVEDKGKEKMTDSQRLQFQIEINLALNRSCLEMKRERDELQKQLDKK